MPTGTSLVVQWLRLCASTARGMGLISSQGTNGTPLQYSCLENPMDGGAWWAAVHGVSKSQTRLSDFPFTFMHWRRKWQPTPVFLPGESQGRGSLVGCRLRGRTESDTTEATQQQQQYILTYFILYVFIFLLCHFFPRFSLNTSNE